ncbi:hypothetical protein Golax_025962, partial [Gossypium laxum]|nr:hypothetical protein [Gossypium laxum]
IPNSVPDCSPPSFPQFENQPSPSAPIHLHQSTSGPPRLHPFLESEVRAKLQTSSTFEFQSLIQKPISVTDEEITEMVLFPTINEACRVLDKGVVARASDLDVAFVLRMSFPSYW